MYEATDSPLLNNYDLKKATNDLVNVTCGKSSQALRMDELSLLETKIGECLGITDNYKKGIVFDEDPDFADKVEVTIIATGVDMMGAVPEDYYSGEREFVPVQVEKEPEVAEMEYDDTMESEPEIVDNPVEESTGLMKVISRIKSEVAKMYDALDDSLDDEV